VCAVLSGNRNFEGRIQQEVRANYLASPPLVVAYALAGRIDLDLQSEALGTGKDGKPVYLRDIWPSAKEVDDVVRSSIKSAMFHKQTARSSRGTSAGAGFPSRRATVRLEPRFDVHPPGAVLRRHAADAGAGQRHPRGTSAVPAG